MRAVTLQPEALEDRSLGVQRRERRVGAAAFGERVDHEIFSDLRVDAPGVTAERARGGRRLERPRAGRAKDVLLSVGGGGVPGALADLPLEADVERSPPHPPVRRRYRVG